MLWIHEYSEKESFEKTAKNRSTIGEGHLNVLPASSTSYSLKIYRHKAFQITYLHATDINSVLQHYSTPHTLWGYDVELASALTVATILADAAVTPTVSEMRL